MSENKKLDTNEYRFLTDTYLETGPNRVIDINKIKYSYISSTYGRHCIIFVFGENCTSSFGDFPSADSACNTMKSIFLEYNKRINGSSNNNLVLED